MISSTEITPELEVIRAEMEAYAKNFGLDFFDVIFEMVDSDQVNSLAAYSGFPVRYPHWRFGMDYDQLSKGYTWGMSKIYEMVINTDPSYAYLVKSNSFVEQKMVMAHVYGHVDFFKNNYWFSKTNRKMLDSMANHAGKIRGIMDLVGQDTVETFIDHCLALENLIDPFLPFFPEKRSKKEAPPASLEVGKIQVEHGYMESFINPPEFIAAQKQKMATEAQKSKKNPPEPMKDVLAFLMHNAPLENWEAEVISIIREEAYYFIPQRQTKIMNEGWASYWHSKIMTEKACKASEIIDFADRHSQVLSMSPGKLNPYAVGLELFKDIEERWDKGRFGKEYDECENMVLKAKWDTKKGLGRKKIFEVRQVCNDVTFIDEYLTPEFVERFKLYTYAMNRRTNQLEIVDRDFNNIKQKLLSQLANSGDPLIYVVDGNFENRGELLLWHKHEGVDLDMRWAKETMRVLSAIWRRPVNVETKVEDQKKILTYAAGEFSEKTITD